MSGTSLDGVDVALIETDGERIAQFGPTGYRPYSDHEQALLRQVRHWRPPTRSDGRRNRSKRRRLLIWRCARLTVCRSRFQLPPA
jgi:1,6-anhydro-N-acetylmuramate kinase